MKWATFLLVTIALTGVSALGQGTDHMRQMPGAMPMHHGIGSADALPTQPGQGAFGAVQEIVGILRADPTTDWSKVNLDTLREHLIDMDEVTLHAAAAVEHIDGGIRVAVTGSGRTLLAIQRMLAQQAREMSGKDGWVETAELRPDGMTLTVTAADPQQVAMIRGLGFIGVIASGGHHQMHHLMMAKGEM